MELSTKTCRRCKQEKQFADFYKNKRIKDGLQHWCKQCIKETGERYLALNKLRQCGKCNANKPLAEFNKKHSAKDGFGSWCKRCERDSKQCIVEHNKARPRHIVDALQKQLVKQCCRCGTNKPLSDFNKLHGNHDGLERRCKQCSHDSSKRSRQRNKERPLDVIAASTPCLKLCRQCNTEKTKSEFPRAFGRKDGLAGRCLACNRLESADYYETNKTRLAIVAKAWQKKNPDKISINGKKWRAKNKERVAAYKTNRRARKRSASGTHTSTDIKALMLLQRGRCAACKTDIRAKYHVDHVTSLVHGGSNDKSNLQLLCPRCNLSKQDQHPIDFMRQKGYLL